MCSSLDPPGKDSPPPDDQPTSWTRIHRAKGSGPGAKQARDEIAIDLLPILYWWAARWSPRICDAPDYAHDILVQILEGDLVHTADPTKGRFTAWAVRCLRNLIRDRIRCEHLCRAAQIEDCAVAAAEADLDAEIDRPELARILDEARRATEATLTREHELAVFQAWVRDVTEGRFSDQEALAKEVGVPLRHFRYLLGKARNTFRDVLARRLRA